jgi:hypothetical protein
MFPEKRLNIVEIFFSFSEIRQNMTVFFGKFGENFLTKNQEFLSRHVPDLSKLIKKILGKRLDLQVKIIFPKSLLK